MPSLRRKPSLTSLTAFCLIVVLYGASYFMMVSVDRSATTGVADATYPVFAEPFAVVFRPMESIDRHMRADMWAPDPSLEIINYPVMREGVIGVRTESISIDTE